MLMNLMMDRGIDAQKGGEKVLTLYNIFGHKNILFYKGKLLFLVTAR